MASAPIVANRSELTTRPSIIDGDQKIDIRNPHTIVRASSGDYGCAAMVRIDEISASGYELAVRVTDESCNLAGFICVHNTLLGPALGGIRWRGYSNDDEALEDVKRLAEGMTFKNALAGLAWGGGKSVIVKTDGDRQDQFVSFGRAIESLKGRYIGAEDVGTTTREIAWAATQTTHVVGVSADPSPLTARGVIAAMRAAANRVFGNRSLASRTIAVAGAGKVGSAIVRLLAEEGAHVVVADPNETALTPLRRYANVEIREPDAVVSAHCDIFAPCAHGGALNSETIRRLDTAIVCGAANNQLAEPRDAYGLARRSILYIPDYLANAGGVISLAAGLERDPAAAADAVDRLEARVDELLGLADEENIEPVDAAARLVAERLRAAQG